MTDRRKKVLIDTSRALASLASGYDSSSESDSVEQGTECTVPSALDIFNSGEHSDAHQGRKRSFAHLTGNWATHVFIKVPEYLCASNGALRSIAKICEQYSNLNLTTVHQIKEVHISLSRTFPLKRQQIEEFIEAVRNGICAEKCSEFSVSVREVRGFENEEKTRSFCGILVHKNREKIERLLKVVDFAAEKLGKPRYYNESVIHASLAWSLGGLFPDAGRYGQPFCSANQSIEFNVDAVFIRTGHIVRKIRLKNE